jgi:hypothetical protein
VKESTSCGHRHQRCDLRTASRLAEHHHAFRIAAELRGVIAHPGERLYEIENADVPRRFVPGATESAEIEMTEGVQSMIDGDHHDIAAMAQARAVVDRTGARSGTELAAVEVDHHGPIGSVAQAWRPYVEDEAIFTHRFRQSPLRTCRPVRQRIARSFPGHWRRWGKEAAR